MRVPSLSPKWQEEEWKGVGRILANGFLDQEYLSLRLAPAFTTALIFGEHAVSIDSLFVSGPMQEGRTQMQTSKDLLTKRQGARTKGAAEPVIKNT